MGSLQCNGFLSSPALSSLQTSLENAADLCRPAPGSRPANHGPPLPVCSAPLPTTQHGRWNREPSGELATLQCNPGYVLSGDGRGISCERAGTWSPWQSDTWTQSRDRCVSVPASCTSFAEMQTFLDALNSLCCGEPSTLATPQNIEPRVAFTRCPLHIAQEETQGVVAHLDCPARATTIVRRPYYLFTREYVRNLSTCSQQCLIYSARVVGRS